MGMSSCPATTQKLDLLPMLLFPLQMEADGAMVSLDHMFFVCSIGSSFVFVIPHWFLHLLISGRWIVSLLNLVCCFCFISPDHTFKCHFLRIVKHWLFEHLSQTQPKQYKISRMHRPSSCSVVLWLLDSMLCWFNFSDFAVSIPSLSLANVSSLTADRLKRIDCNCFGWSFA